LVLHRHEAAGNINSAGLSAETREAKESPHGEICHQMGPKDYLQQEPGWMHPGVHRLRVTLKCTTWSHRERRLLRSGRAPIEAAALQKQYKTPGHERSPSPPPKLSMRMLQPPIEAFETFDLGQTDVPENNALIGGVTATKRRNISPHTNQDKIDHELVEHHIICGVVSGHQRHGVRFSQREPNAIYYAEDLNGKQCVQIGGTTTSISFDLELVIFEPTKNGISRCRFAVLRDKHSMLEECFEVSAKVPLVFNISSASFDANSSYTVHARWHAPHEHTLHEHTPHDVSLRGASMSDQLHYWAGMAGSRGL